MRSQATRESCRHPLTTDQMVEAGKELAAAQSELRQTEDEWKSRTSAIEARITTVARRISRGYDIRETPCTVYFDDPEPNLKTCVRDDNGERVWVREMTESDKQLVLDLTAEPLKEGEE